MHVVPSRSLQSFEGRNCKVSTLKFNVQITIISNFVAAHKCFYLIFYCFKSFTTLEIKLALRYQKRLCMIWCRSTQRSMEQGVVQDFVIWGGANQELGVHTPHGCRLHRPFIFVVG